MCRPGLGNRPRSDTPRAQLANPTVERNLTYDAYAPQAAFQTVLIVVQFSGFQVAVFQDS